MRGGLFEDYPVRPREFAAVLSANAWQWVDARAGYRKAAGLLPTGGCLRLVWTFPIVADSCLQRALNSALGSGYPDAVRDPDTHRAGIEARAAEGREEIAASGLFDPVWWETRTDTLTVTPDAYYELLLSYANVAILDAEARDDFRQQVMTALDGAVDVVLDNVLYACVARRREDQ